MRVESEILFSAGVFRALALSGSDVPVLQRFFEGNPEYFLAVTGELPSCDEAKSEMTSLPPPDWPYSRKWTIGFFDEGGSCAAMADVVSDLLAPGVWHIGLFIVATELHGTGVAQTIYASLEKWADESGAEWLRLGVVEGNLRAERFWAQCGFIEIRRRKGLEMGQRVNDVRVLVKPLRHRPVLEYTAWVPRDRPDS